MHQQEGTFEAEDLGFTQIPHELAAQIREKTNTKGQAKVMQQLLMLTLGNQKTSCLTDIRTLAKDTRIGKNTVHRALKAFCGATCCRSCKGNP